MPLSPRQVRAGWVTPSMVAAATGVSHSTVRRCCESGDLPHYRLPCGSRERRIRRRDAEAWARRHGIPLHWKTLMGGTGDE